MPHTPGPWKYDANDKLNPSRAFGIVRLLGKEFDEQAGVEGATEVIAEVCYAPRGTAEADARLIAEAPAMLAYIERVERFILSLPPAHEDATATPRACLLADARSIIASIEGGTA